MLLATPGLIRKAIHFSVGILILVLSHLVEKEILLWLIIAGTSFSFITFPYKRFYLLHKTSGASLGTLFYPLGILSAYLLLYNMPLFYFQTALLVLIISDTVANLIGQVKSGNGWFSVLHDNKSLHGIAGFVLTTLVIIFLYLPLELLTNPFYLFFLLLIAVTFETVSSRGSDNFSIPFGMAVFFYLSSYYQLNYVHLSAAFIILSLGCYLLFRFKILTRYGSFAAWLLGLYLVYVAGIEWLITVLAFFISSVIFTKIRAAIRGKKKESNGRNAWQVTANILWAVLSSVLYVITDNQVFIHLFIVYVAAVTADTWASEIGPIINKSSFSLADLKMHEAGTTGAISFAGTLAALAGSVFIAFLSFWMITGEINLHIIAIISFSSFLACFADTLLGAFVENKLLKMPYFSSSNNNERITPNDIVNLAGSLTAGMFYGLFML
jgi:uncharacterized protein (TIGR00297 family)